MSREHVANPPTRVLVMAASTRAESINQALAIQIHNHLKAAGASVGLVDLADHILPLYHGDLEANEGVPASAHTLAERISAAEVMVIVSPEYNGAFTPLLKNTIDWVTRIDKRVLAHLTVMLAAASPGPGGGARGLAMIAQWMTNMRVPVADTTLSVGGAQLGTDRALVGVDIDDLTRFAAQALT